MKLKKIKISELKEPYDFPNYNKHPQSQIDELKKSLEKFLQYKNIVVWKDNQVIAGNGLVEAARQLGWEEIYVNDRNDLDEKTAMALLISDNASPFGSFSDDDELRELVEQLDGIEVPGMNEWLKNMDFDILNEQNETNPPDDFNEYDEEINTDYCCPKCGYKWSGKQG